MRGRACGAMRLLAALGRIIEQSNSAQRSSAALPAQSWCAARGRPSAGPERGPGEAAPAALWAAGSGGAHKHLYPGFFSRPAPEPAEDCGAGAGTRVPDISRKWIPTIFK